LGAVRASAAAVRGTQVGGSTQTAQQQPVMATPVRNAGPQAAPRASSSGANQMASLGVLSLSREIVGSLLSAATASSDSDSDEEYEFQDPSHVRGSAAVSYVGNASSEREQKGEPLQSVDESGPFSVDLSDV